MCMSAADSHKQSTLRVQPCHVLDVSISRKLAICLTKPHVHISSYRLECCATNLCDYTHSVAGNISFHGRDGYEGVRSLIRNDG